MMGDNSTHKKTTCSKRETTRLCPFFLLFFYIYNLRDLELKQVKFAGIYFRFSGILDWIVNHILDPIRIMSKKEN